MPILRTFATADIGGTVYKVRIEQFKRSGYVTVWDGGSEHEVRVASADIMAEIYQANHGGSDLRILTRKFRTMTLRPVCSAECRERADGWVIAQQATRSGNCLVESVRNRRPRRRAVVRVERDAGWVLR